MKNKRNDDPTATLFGIPMSDLQTTTETYSAPITARRAVMNEHDRLRERVRAAAGAWLLVHEQPCGKLRWHPLGRLERCRVRSRFFSVTRMKGFTHTGLFVKAMHRHDGTLAVWMRFLADRVIQGRQS